MPNPFDTRYYSQGGITTSPFSDGATNIDGIVDTVAATTYVPPTYSYEQTYQSVIGFSSPISGYSNYTFNSTNGIFSNSGSYITYNPGASGGVVYNSLGDELISREPGGGVYLESIFTSYVVSWGVSGNTTINDSYNTSIGGTYTIYGWVKATNGLYYNAGSYVITVGGVIRIYDGSDWKMATPYIYDGSNWKIAIPYIYDGSNWKIGI